MRNVHYISASAGSGKTYTLTHKLAEAIEQGVRPEEVILTTFTKKAAAEFKEKAKQVLYEKGLYEAADRLDKAMMGTVHSVALSFLQKYWYLLGISPDMNVMSEEDVQFYISQSLSDIPTDEELKVLNGYCEQCGLTENGQATLNYDYWKEYLNKIVCASSNYSIEKLEESKRYSVELVQSLCQKGTHLTYDVNQIEAVLREWSEINEKTRESKAKEGRRTLLEEFQRGLRKLTWGKLSKLKREMDNLPQAFQTEAAIALSEQLHNIWTTEEVCNEQIRVIELLFKLAERWKQAYYDYKSTKRLVDYDDMERYMWQLLENTEVAGEIAGNYKLLLVDEFQDSSPIQIRIFDRLSDWVERSIWVGDYKQAIYGFRGTDTDLVKAVMDTIQRKENGCSSDTLGISYRSYPDIVELVNKVFVPAFNPALPEEQVALTCNKKNEEQLQSLRYWPLQGRNAANRLQNVTQRMVALLQSGEKPEDIAVLSGTNKPLDELSRMLQPYNIPVVRDENADVSRDETQLICALLSLIVDATDDHARAQIAFLTEPGYGIAKIMDEKLAYNQKKKQQEEHEEYLAQVPLIQQILQKRESYRHLPVSALVESVIVELDLYNVVATWENPTKSVAMLRATIDAAVNYEERCKQLMLPATISGFVSLLKSQPLKVSGERDGIHLLTYHGSKGLEWKSVILFPLDDNPVETHDLLKKEFYGVHAVYQTVPTAGNLFPPMFIRVLPAIVSGNTNIPEEIAERMTDKEIFQSMLNKRLEEHKRLLYVGMTRASKVLVLASPAGNTALQSLRVMGVKVNTEAQDILGVGIPFRVESETQPIEEGWMYREISHEEVKVKGVSCDNPARDLSPSKMEGDLPAVVEMATPYEARLIRISGQPEMSEVGSCIHDVFCALEQEKPQEMIHRVVHGYGLEHCLAYPEEIQNSWERLVSHLTDTYGHALAVFHELPFKHFVNGQVVTGSMDLVWKTENGCVLVDFKTFPGRIDWVLNQGEHYAGNYWPQFTAYKNALEVHHETVLDCLVYYPVTGLVIRLSDEVGEDDVMPFLTEEGKKLINLQ